MAFDACIEFGNESCRSRRTRGVDVGCNGREELNADRIVSPTSDHVGDGSWPEAIGPKREFASGVLQPVWQSQWNLNVSRETMHKVDCRASLGCEPAPHSKGTPEATCGLVAE